MSIEATVFPDEKVCYPPIRDSAGTRVESDCCGGADIETPAGVVVG